MLAVDRDRIAAEVFDFDILRLVRRVFGRDREAKHVVVRLAPRVLEDAALVAYMDEVAIHRVRLLGGGGEGNILFAGVGNHVGAAYERPIGTPPRRDDLQVRREPRKGQLEAHLVVAFAGRAMRDSVGTFRARNLDQFLRDDWSRDRGAEQVVALVNGARAEHREYEIASEFLAQIDDIKFARSRLERLIFEALSLVALPDVGAIRDDLAAEVVLDPAQHDRRVEPARIREHQFIYFFGCHDSSLRRRSSLQNFGTYQPDHHRLLRMQPVLGLIEHDRARSVEHVIGDFLAAMCRQAMHDERALARILHQRVVDLESLEVAPALRSLFLAAHRGPGVGVNDVGVLDRGGRIVGERADFLVAQPRHERLLRLVAFGTREAQLETRQRGCLDPALRQVEAVTHEGDTHLAEIASEALPQRHQIGQQLARMKQIGEAVDDGHGRFARQLDRGLVREGANHDQINRARNVPRDILDRLALADTDIVWREINRMPTKLRHASLEGDASPQRRLLKYHRERPPAQVRMLESNFELGLEPRAERQQAVEFSRRERAEIEEVAFQLAAHFGIGAFLNAFSMIARPASASSRVRFSGGNNLSTLPAVPLTSSRFLRHSSTIGRASCLSTAPMIIPSPRTSRIRSHDRANSLSRSSM